VRFGVIGVSFRRVMATSSAFWVSFAFIHTNDVPFPAAGFYGFLFAAKCFKTPPHFLPAVNHHRRVASCGSP
jgi:hypothetical protein